MIDPTPTEPKVFLCVEDGCLLIIVRDPDARHPALTLDRRPGGRCYLDDTATHLVVSHEAVQWLREVRPLTRPEDDSWSVDWASTCRAKAFAWKNLEEVEPGVWRVEPGVWGSSGHRAHRSFAGPLLISNGAVRKYLAYLREVASPPRRFNPEEELQRILRSST